VNTSAARLTLTMFARWASVTAR